MAFESLRRWVKKEPQGEGSGRFRSVLTPKEEQDIMEALKISAQLGWPCGTEEVKVIVKTFLDNSQRDTTFIENNPGKDWLIGFKKRWSNQLGMRNSEIISKSHAENLTAEASNKFFEVVRSIYNDKSIFQDANAAKRIYNADKSGFSTNPNQKKMFLKKSCRNAYMITPTSGKAMCTVLAIGNAAGEFMPPFSCVSSSVFK